MKKRVKVLIIVIAIISIVFLISGIIIYNNDNLRFKYEYEIYNHIEYSNGKRISVSIPSDNRIKILSEDELIEKFKSGTGIIYIGYPSCPWCRNIVEVLLNFSNDYNETIYYTDVHSIKSRRNEILEILDPYLKSDDNNEKRLYVPDVFFVKNGSVVGHHLSTVEGYTNPFKGMNNKEKKELYNIYLDLYNNMNK